MPKTIIDHRGIYQIADGDGFEIAGAVTTSQLPTTTVSAKTTSATLTSPGVYTLSGSSAALTMVLPLAADVAGGLFVFRSLSAHAHVLTSSQETGGSSVFAGMPGATPANRGAAVTLPSVVGSSVALISDGLNFLVTATSGSAVISG